MHGALPSTADSASPCWFCLPLLTLRVACRQAGLLFYGCPFVACAGLFTNGATSLIIFRAFIGAAGATFVPCQAWTSLLFAPRIVGTANAFSAGWGNLGGGVTQLAMPAFMAVFVALGAEESSAWRMAMIVPAVLFLCVGTFVWMCCDDCPQGKFGPSKKRFFLASNLYQVLC